MTSNTKTMRDGCAYIDEEFVPIALARIPLLDWGFTRGDACQDTVSVRAGSFFRLEDHLERFAQSCAALKYTAVDGAHIETVLHGLVGRTGLRDATVQMIMTRGSGATGSRDPRHCTNRFMAFAVPFISVATDEQRERGLSVSISERWRLPPQSVPSQIKNYNWIDFVLSLFEAYEAGAETSLLLNHLGHVTEGPGFNFFAHIDGCWTTPGYNVLNGITRRTVLELWADIGVEVKVEAVLPEQLMRAAEAFICTTAGGIVPITHVDGKPIGRGIPGISTRVLSRMFTDRRAAGWRCTPVDYHALEQAP